MAGITKPALNFGAQFWMNACQRHRGAGGTQMEAARTCSLSQDLSSVESP